MIQGYLVHLTAPSQGKKKNKLKEKHFTTEIYKL